MLCVCYRWGTNQWFSISCQLMNPDNSPNTHLRGYWWLCWAALSRSWKPDQNPNAAPNIWVNIQFLATQKQTKQPGDWEELHLHITSYGGLFSFSGKGVSGPNFKSNPTTSQLITIIRLLSNKTHSSEAKAFHTVINISNRKYWSPSGHIVISNDSAVRWRNI